MALLPLLVLQEVATTCVLFVWFLLLEAGNAAERQKHTSRERSYAPERAIPTVALRPWLHALKRLHVIGPDLSERDAVRCFSWARMADCH